MKNTIKISIILITIMLSALNGYSMCTPTYTDFDDAICASSGSAVVNGACYNGDNTGQLFCSDLLFCVPTDDQFVEWVSFDATQPYAQLDVTGAASTPTLTLMTYSTDCPATDNTTCPAGGGSACIFTGQCVTSTTGVFTNLTVGRTYYVAISTATGGTYQACFTADHCINGVQDADETGNDCGGVDCAPCGGTGYTHPTAGIAGTFAGACMVNTCSDVYTDDGGGAGNYSAGVNSIYRVFCPDAYGQCMQATFTQLDILTGFMGGCVDYVLIGDGATQNNPILWAGCGTSTAAGDVETLAGSYSNPLTATNESGCLSFRFNSNGASSTRPGYSINLSCTNCATAGNGPQAGSGEDCTDGSTQICGEAAAVTGTATGPGISADGCSGCTSAGGENYSLWYYFDATVSGDMELIIQSTNGTDDYDFALYRANDCGSLGTPIRCSYAATVGPGGTTGMVDGSGGNNEGVSGDGFVEDVPIVAGDRYYLMVNEWSRTGSGFSLNFTFTNGASINCIPPILKLSVLEFDAYYNGKENAIEWLAQTDENVTSFTIEKSTDGKNFKTYEEVKSDPQGEKTFYTIFDKAEVGTYYYRIKQNSNSNKEAEYSEVKKVVVSNLDIKVNPNVFGNTMLVSLNAVESTDLQINITNIHGQTVVKEFVNIPNGSSSISLSTSDLAKGVYFVRIKDLKNHTVTNPLKVIKE